MYEMPDLTIKNLTDALMAEGVPRQKSGEQGAARRVADRPQAPELIEEPEEPEEPEGPEEPIVVSIEYGEVRHTSELVEFLRLANEQQQAEGVWRPTLDPFRAQGVLANMMSANCVIVVTMDHKIVGSLGFWPHKEEWATDDSWVLVEKWFYVHPECRSLGLAEKLFDQFLDEAMKRNLPCICGIWSGKDVAMKEKFLSRRGVKYVGGMFVGEPPGVQQRNDNHH
jgi:GNAT superfamily N-acetyltransferase